MKKIVSLFVALGLIPMTAFAQISGQVTGSGLTQQVNLVAAPQNRADGTASGSTADREGNTKEVLGHAEYTESARRGKMYTLAATAFTITAANARNQALGVWKPILGFINPAGSGVNAVLVNARAFHTSGTTGGPLVWNFFCGQNWTTSGAGTVFNDLLSNNSPAGSSMIAENNVAPAASPANTSTILDFAAFGGPDTTALSSGGEAGHYEDLKGQIVVPPGCVWGLSATATGTSDVVSASLSWEEVAQ